MKMYSMNFKIVLISGLAIFLAIFITRPACSQETAKKESHKKVTVKIVSDDNGETTVIDTTMEVQDSVMMDSVQKEIDKVIRPGRGGSHARVRIHEMPRGYSYNFEMPPIPECPMNLDELEDLDLEGMIPGRDFDRQAWEGMAPGPDRRIMRSGGNGQSLNDMLGDIPMDHVVSYSIRDHKHGKRITIDLNDAPMFEKQNKVVIIRNPGRAYHPGNHQRRQVKVFVTPDNEEQPDVAPEPAAPRSAPTPPAAKPDTTTPKKPKI